MIRIDGRKLRLNQTAFNFWFIFTVTDDEDDEEDGEDEEDEEDGEDEGVGPVSDFLINYSNS